MTLPDRCRQQHISTSDCQIMSGCAAQNINNQNNGLSQSFPVLDNILWYLNWAKFKEILQHRTKVHGISHKIFQDPLIILCNNKQSAIWRQNILKQLHSKLLHPLHFWIRFLDRIRLFCTVYKLLFQTLINTYELDFVASTSFTIKVQYFDFVHFHCISLFFALSDFKSLLQNFSLARTGSKLGNFGLGDGES